MKIIYNSYDDKRENEDYEKWQLEILDECYRVLKIDGHLFYNHRNRYEKGVCIMPIKWLLKTKFNIFQQIIWDTKKKVDNNRAKFTPSSEYIFWLRKDNRILKLKDGSLLGDIWEIGRSEIHNTHPAPFPLKLPVRILKSLYEDGSGKMVMDCFCGSGTVGVAAKLLGHNFIGIDFDEEYGKMAKERILNIYKKDLENFQKEIELHVVKESYQQRLIRNGGKRHWKK